MSQLNHLNHKGYNQLKKLLDVHSSKALVQANYIAMTPEERESFRGTITVLREEKKRVKEQLTALDATLTTVREIEKTLSRVVVPTNDSQDGFDSSSPRSEDSTVAPVQQSLFGRIAAAVGTSKSKSSSSSSQPEKKKRKAGSTLFDSFDTFFSVLHFLNSFYTFYLLDTF